MRNIQILGFAALALAACSSGTTEPGEVTIIPGAQGASAGTLVKSTKIPADATCVTGGTRLDFGTDKNQNGQLDADEITTTQKICNPSATPTLTAVTANGPTPTCINGGTTVKSGPDTNGNGVLDDAEVTATNEICGGGASTQLATTTAITAGDATCPLGGSTTRSGVDNGTGGGIAGNGVLEAGEVLATIATCMTRNTTPVASVTPPGGAAGTGMIQVGGGAGTAGNGGDSGTFIAGFGASGAYLNHVRVFKTGKADGSVTLPADVPQFGAMKLDVLANLTIASYASPASATDGEYYTISNSGLFFRLNVGSPQIAVTGVHVAAGVTLTFPAIAVTLPNDFHNQGTITSTADASGNRATVSITANEFIGAAGSHAITSGLPIAGAAGGSGGNWRIFAGRIVNAGTIDTSGAAGDVGQAGGAAGFIMVSATTSATAGPAYQTGDLKTNGGQGNGGGAGGAAGAMSLLANERGVFVQGTLEASGGGGAGGGATGPILINAAQGPVRFKGGLTQRGGDVDDAACATMCSGGASAALNVNARGADLTWEGPIVRTGSKSKGMTGGSVAVLFFQNADVADASTSANFPAGAIRISGGIDNRGGMGTAGGTGGNFRASVTTSNSTASQEVDLFGYATVDATGGAGTSGGGAGGAVTVTNPDASGARAAGGVVLYPDFFTRGGAATASGNGGTGGAVIISSGTTNSAPGDSQAFYFAGIADASGGAGVAAGGAAGAMTLTGRERVDITGATITAVGGDASGGNAGAGAAFTIVSGGAVAAASAITVGGGASTSSNGGASGAVSIKGTSVSLGGAVVAKGGNGNNLAGAGGNGGAITVSGSLAASKVTALSSPFGIAVTNGTSGAILVDGNVY